MNRTTQILVALGLLWPTLTAQAEPRLRVDDAELVETTLGDAVRVYATPINLQGNLLAAGTNEFELLIGTRGQSVAHIANVFADMPRPREIAIVVRSTQDFSEVWDNLDQILPTFVDDLAGDVHVRLITYDDEVQGGRELMGSLGLKDELDGATLSEASLSPKLLDAVTRALSRLTRAKQQNPQISPMLLVLSDGQNHEQEPALFHDLADLASSRDIPIHSIAFSSTDFRSPMLGLGTLSKKSGGTFRWLRTSTGLRPMFKSLSRELNQQKILHFFIPRDKVIGKPLYLSLDTLKSDQFIVGKPSCGGMTCDGYCAGTACLKRAEKPSIVRTYWPVAAAVVAGIVVLILLVALLSGRARASSPRKPKAALPSQARGQLLVIAGGLAGQRFPAAHGMQIGSAPNCHIVLPPTPTLAPSHAVLEAQKGGVLSIVDISGKGVMVNGVSTPRKLLQHGMSVQIGGILMRYLEPQ